MKNNIFHIAVCVCLFVAAVLGGFFVFASRATAATVIHSQNYITTPQTWTKAMSPIVILGSGGIGPGGSVTIEPGVVVKFGVGAQFGTGNGTMTAVGTPEEPIIFTALTDDSAAGDTNEDGNATSPALGYWGRLYLGHDQDQIQFAEFRYGSDCIHTSNAIILSHDKFLNCGHGLNLGPGFSGVVDDNIFDQNVYGIYMLSSSAPAPAGIRNNLVTNSQFAGIYQSGTGFLDISNNEITRNRNGIYIEYGSLSVFSQNNIYQNTDYGFYNHGTFSVDARNNWWGDPSGPFHDTLNPLGRGDRVGGAPVTFEPWLGQEVKLPSGKDPVIIVPGILGSELWNGSDLIWADLGQMFDDNNDEFLTENLSLDEEGVSIRNINVGQVIEKFDLSLFGLGSATVLDIFENLITDLESGGYTFNNTYFLFPYDWRLNLDSTRLALKDRIENIKAQTGSEKVDIIAHSMGGLLVEDLIKEYGGGSIGKLIFVGVPHLGAPKAAKVLLWGDRFDVPWLEEDRIMELSRNSISTYELLPSQKYFENFIGYLRPYSLFGTPPLDYAGTKEFLLNHGLNPNVFAKAEGFFAKNLYDLDYSGIDVYNLAGCRRNTQAGYGLAIGNNSVGQFKYTTGDATVPLPSADYISLPAHKKYYVKKGKHAALPSTPGVRELIVQILSETVSPLPDNISNDSSFCKFQGKEALWRSPVEVHIYDASGNHTGPIENNTIEYGIDGVGYEVIGEEKFVFLPTDDGETYQIVARGEAEGTLDLQIAQNDNGEVIQSSVFNDVAITASSTIELVISDISSDDSLSLDSDGDGTSEIVTADSLLNAVESQDLTLPETTAGTLSGELGQNGWYTSPVSIALEASDDNTGILETRYSLDGGASFRLYTAPVTVEQEGINLFMFYSVDRAGNNEETKSLEIKIDETPPEVQVEYNLDQHDFSFVGLDDTDPAPSIVCNAATCTVEDSAGHSTALTYSQKGENQHQTLKLLEVLYDGEEIQLPENRFLVRVRKPRGILTEFKQRFVMKTVEIISVDYKAKRDQSVIISVPKGQKPTREVMDGVRFLQIQTDGGSIKTGIK